MTDATRALLHTLKVHGVILALLGSMALFFYNQGSRSEPAFGMDDIHTVEGRVSAFESIRTDGFSDRTRRFYKGIDHIIRLEGFPDRLIFRIGGQLDGDVPVGAPVRLEIEGDPAEKIEAIQDHPDFGATMTSRGLTVDGRTIFSAEGAIDRAEDASWSRKRLGLLFGAAFLVWGGAVIWRRRHDLRETARNLGFS